MSSVNCLTTVFIMYALGNADMILTCILRQMHLISSRILMTYQYSGI